MERVDLGVCEGQLFRVDPARAAVLLPGAGYPTAAPLLWFARKVLQANGWTVLQVWDAWDGGDGHRWARDRFEAALRFVGDVPTRLVVAKSLTTYALPAAVDLGLPGVWLTPLCGDESVRRALASASSPTLVIGGSDDPTWDATFIRGLPNLTVLEIEGAGHVLEPDDDPMAALDALRLVTTRMDEFVKGLAPRPARGT